MKPLKTGVLPCAGPGTIGCCIKTATNANGTKGSKHPNFYLKSSIENSLYLHIPSRLHSK